MKIRMLLVTGGALIAGVLLFMILIPLGFPPDFTIAWMLLILALALLGRQSFLDESPAWPPEHRTQTIRGSDVSRLAWSINTRTGVVGHVVVRRLERMLARRMRHHGLDLDDETQHPQIDALLGPGNRELLGRREVHRDEVERVLDALDRLQTTTDVPQKESNDDR